MTKATKDRHKDGKSLRNWANTKTKKGQQCQKLTAETKHFQKPKSSLRPLLRIIPSLPPSVVHLRCSEREPFCLLSQVHSSLREVVSYECERSFKCTFYHMISETKIPYCAYNVLHSQEMESVNSQSKSS